MCDLKQIVSVKANCNKPFKAGYADIAGIFKRSSYTSYSCKKGIKSIVHTLLETIVDVKAVHLPCNILKVIPTISQTMVLDSKVTCYLFYKINQIE